MFDASHKQQPRCHESPLRMSRGLCQVPGELATPAHDPPARALPLDGGLPVSAGRAWAAAAAQDAGTGWYRVCHLCSGTPLSLLSFALLLPADLTRADSDCPRLPGMRATCISPLREARTQIHSQSGD